MNDELIRVLVVDDTVTYRTILSNVIESIPECALVGTSSNGEFALKKLAFTATDMVLLDVEMPFMGGLETLEIIHRNYPEVGVIMISGMNRDAATITIQALEQGAIDFVSKPDGESLHSNRKELETRIRSLVQLFSTRRTVRRMRVSPRPAPDLVDPRPIEIKHPAKTPLPVQIDVVVIGLSTGGPNALKALLPALPTDLGVPVLIVQHMPPIFTASMAESLNRHSTLTVREACDGDLILPNHVYIAPGGFHMIVDKQGDGQHVIVVNNNPPEKNCRPSVNALFRSVADTYGGHILSVVMTGMGDDGCEGVRAMKRKGCYSLTQSNASCVVYGMPRVVNEAGLSDAELSLEEMAPCITSLVRNNGWSR